MKTGVEEFEKYSLDTRDRLQVQLLEDILKELKEVNYNLSRILQTQPRPSS